ncbi:hypothetical protein GCM10020367_46350 [Streptomyces sannanensis]|uniref:Polysaccharide lyase family 8 C-terminal domain-containing protein n=1 Tax=Streptomyces sannanensis TaxID=285536 RepID=A0ABP6SGW1_9ACTN
MNASYAYLMMSGASARTPAARADDEGRLEIPANSAHRQAVVVASLGCVVADFRQPGTVGPPAVTGPASVLVRPRRSRIVLCASGPARSGEPLEIGWNRPVRVVTHRDPSVQALATGRGLRLRITPGVEGVTHRVMGTL